MSKGTIVLIPFPFTDLSGYKIRPTVVLSDLGEGEDCIVAFISSVKQKTANNFSLPVEPSKQNGLKSSSIIRMDKLATLQKKIILGELGKLETKLISQINHKLKNLFRL
ncbi:MAG: type II toxin-antitoxin system PemK/MazF family toxin [Candidatus Vogelbacteria bacterium]|nr:type II toxin-antitoxin system PemK/MazF family toxin [Candidatus Vogelbacteria bacterium]